MTEPLFFRVLDIGCGTGCIGISIAKEISETFVTAIDIEPIAVLVSNHNAQRILPLLSEAVEQYNSNRYVAQCIDIAQFGSDIKKQLMDDPNNNRNNLLYDMVVSNPPYILPGDMEALETSVLQYESHTALNGGGTDGLYIIRMIIQQLPHLCNNHAICWMEIDPSQPKLIQDYIEQQTFNEHRTDTSIQTTTTLSNTNTDDDNNNNNNTKKKRICFVECVKDMFGHDRFVKLQVVIDS